MKIINQTPEEMIITHPSRTKIILGVLLLLIAFALFLFLLRAMIEAVALAAFFCVSAGATLLFMNAAETIELDTRSGTATRRRSFSRGTAERYPLSEATAVEIDAGPDGGLASYILFGDVRLLIDRKHGQVRTSLSDAARNDAATRERTIASRVARFLELPVIERAS